MDIQEQVNTMVKNLRMAVIKKLLMHDIYKFGAAKTVDEAEIAWRANEIYKMDIPTANLKRLFEDCHEYCREIGMFDGPVRIADLEFCVKKRCIGFKCSGMVKNNWLPRNTDPELRALPEFKKLAELYISNGNRAIAPTQTKTTAEPTVRFLANKIGVNNAV